MKYKAVWNNDRVMVPSMDERMKTLLFLGLFAVVWPIAAFVGVLVFALSGVVIPIAMVMMGIAAISGKVILVPERDETKEVTNEADHIEDESKNERTERRSLLH